MLYLVGRRFVESGITIVGLVVLVFVLVRLTGNPGDLFLPLDASLEVRQAYSHAHGFDLPLATQFWTFLGDLAQGDLGLSYREQRPALAIVAEAFPTTLFLALIGILLVSAIAIPAGALAAWRPGSRFDQTASVLSLAAGSMPDFWIAIVGILVFAVTLHWLPTSGDGSFSHWILPVIVLSVRPIGFLFPVVRGAMIEALSSGYAKTARAKGAGPSRIVFVHGLRNAMLPIITVVGDQAVGILNGAVIVETIFGLPGMGRLMIEAITNRDFAVIQAGVLFITVVIFLLNILIDLTYAAFDPRLRNV